MVGPVGPGAGCSVGVVGSGCGVVVPVGPVPPVLVAPVELLVGFGEVAPVVPVLPVTPVGDDLLVGVSFLGATVGFSSCFSSGWFGLLPILNSFGSSFFGSGVGSVLLL